MAARQKVLSIEDAVQALVHDGSLIAFTAEMDAVPMTAVREIVRAGRRGLRLVGLPGNGIAQDMLLGAGCAVEAEICHCSLGPFGPAPNFKRLAEAGRITVKDNT